MQGFFKAAVDEMAAKSLRCVAIAYRSCEPDKVPTDEESLDKWTLPEDELILLAIVGIKVYILNHFPLSYNFFSQSSIILNRVGKKVSLAWARPGPPYEGLDKGLR